jgi:hypothetical protein
MSCIGIVLFIFIFFSDKIVSNFSRLTDCQFGKILHQVTGLIDANFIPNFNKATRQRANPAARDRRRAQQA